MALTNNLPNMVHVAISGLLRGNRSPHCALAKCFRILIGAQGGVGYVRPGAGIHGGGSLTARPG